MSGERSRWRVNRHVRSTCLEGIYVLVDLRAGKYFALDAVGSTIWAALSDGRSIEDAVDHVTREYAVTRDRAADDAVAFVERLADAGFVEAMDRDPA